MGGGVISHDSITTGWKELFRWDGVHLTDYGNDIYLSELSDGLKQYLHL